MIIAYSHNKDKCGFTLDSSTQLMVKFLQKGKVIQMLKSKKIMSVLLSLIMAFGVFSIAAFAESTLISEITVDIDIEAGMTLADIGEFVIIKSDGLELDDDDGSAAMYVYHSQDGADFTDEDVFENDVAYNITLFLKPSAGYEFDDSIKYVTVNGRKTDKFTIDSYEGHNSVIIYTGISLENFIINEEPYTKSYIEKAEIEFNTDIKGVSVNDYESYITILTENLEFEDNYGDLAVYVYDSKGNEVTNTFKSGETYTVYVYLTANNGYKLSGYVEGSVNGEEVGTYVSAWWPDEEYGVGFVEYVELEYTFTVDGEKEFNIFESIINFFRNLFEKFLDIFRIHPMPI